MEFNSDIQKAPVLIAELAEEHFSRKQVGDIAERDHVQGIRRDQCWPSKLDGVVCLSVHVTERQASDCIPATCMEAKRSMHGPWTHSELTCEKESSGNVASTGLEMSETLLFGSQTVRKAAVGKKVSGASAAGECGVI